MSRKKMWIVQTLSAQFKWIMQGGAEWLTKKAKIWMICLKNQKQ